MVSENDNLRTGVNFRPRVNRIHLVVTSDPIKIRHVLLFIYIRQKIIIYILKRKKKKEGAAIQPAATPPPFIYIYIYIVLNF
jgi:hypothetical protein